MLSGNRWSKQMFILKVPAAISVSLLMCVMGCGHSPQHSPPFNPRPSGKPVVIANPVPKPDNSPSAPSPSLSHTPTATPTDASAPCTGAKSCVPTIAPTISPTVSPTPSESPQPPDAASPNPKRPVILVPGFMEAVPAAFLKGISAHLKKQGWDKVYYLNNGLVVAKAEKYAQRVKDKVDAVLKATGSNKVDIIAHSYGGLYTRYYLKNLGGTEQVDHFISIASPHKGTNLAYMGPFLESARQMKPGSEFLTDLNAGDVTPGALCYAAIRTNTDEIVFPADNAILDGADNYLIRTREHFSILYTKETYQIITNTLNKSCHIQSP